MNEKDQFGMKRVLKEHRIGALKDVPVEIIQQILFEAALQGNSPNVAIKAFQKDLKANKEEGGFDWIGTKDELGFWNRVLVIKDWFTFYKKYPMDIKPKSPRAKMTTARNLSKGQIIRTINLLSHILTNRDIILVESEKDAINSAIVCLSTTVYDVNVSNEEDLWNWRTKYLSGAIKLKSDQDEDNKKD